ncbi:MAG: sugar transferase [Gammaproteobacteria bacterium]|nr:sugar transferase [Gammaproteobacteria bacterium]
MHYQTSKRAFDIGFAILLTLASLPFIPIIALLIVIEDPGSVFFRQLRTGQFKQPFYIIKFRTMYRNTTGSSITRCGDERVTRVGRILRKTKLDELPQLINVLKGDMSIVGPRPEVVSHLPYYDLEDSKIIFAHRPGITDLASLLYIHEERLLAESTDPNQTYYEVILPEKNRLRIRHLTQESLLFDLKIVIWTVLKIVLHHRIPMIECPPIKQTEKSSSTNEVIHEHSLVEKDVMY